MGLRPASTDTPSSLMIRFDWCKVLNLEEVENPLSTFIVELDSWLSSNHNPFSSGSSFSIIFFLYAT